jgi:L-2-hydroxyglutarate oxidase LhgO
MTVLETECIVIGAGVVGLAVARELALAGREVILLEKENIIGSGTSSRNSEVIHAGIYYPAGSLKAKFCVEGNKRLYAYCKERHVPHRNIGKVIVATADEQLAKLKDIDGKARANGVTDLRFLDKAEINSMEPEVTAVGALFSPSTGIIDSHKYMETLLGDFENAGGSIVYEAPVEGGSASDHAITLQVGGKDPCTIRARYLVNSAGLYAIRFMQMLKGFPEQHIPQQFFAKGNYFTLSCKSPFRFLVYPVPVAAGLGTHATLDMAGQCRFGPDVEWVDDPEQLAVDPARAQSFYEAIRTYWPSLPEGALQPGYAGMRPKLQTPSGAAVDFVLQGPQTHGIKGLVNLMGIESPGLTSSLPIAEATKNLLFS